MEKKPEWKHKVPFEFAKWLSTNYIICIEVKQQMTSADTADYWKDLHSHNDEIRRCPVPIGTSEMDEVYITPNDHAGLVSLSRRVLADLSAILAWEKQNAHDIAELARLKTKLGVA